MSLNYKFSENNKVLSYQVTADHTTDTDVAWVDASNFRKFTAMTTATLLTGAGVDKFLIEVAASSTGASSVVAATSLITAAPDAIGDMLFLEIDIDDAAVALNLLSGGKIYVNVLLNAANASDDTQVTYILGEAKHKAAGLSADIVA